MLLMVEKGIRDGMCQVTHRYAKANNRYMKNYDKNTELSYLVYLDANNLYEWAMSQKLPINSFKQVKELSKFNESLIKNYDENSDKGIFLKQMLSIQKKIFILYRDLPLLPDRKKIGKCNKLVCTVQDKENYADHITTLKQDLNRGLILKKVHRVIQFNQKARLKPHIDMNTELRKQKK